MTQPSQRSALLPADAATSFLLQGDVGRASPAYASFRRGYGFIPNHILAQARLPRLLEAELHISNAFLFRERALSRTQKELILLAVAAAHENPYVAALSFPVLHAEGLGRDQLNQVLLDYRRASLADPDVALIDFALRLARHPTWATQADIEGLRMQGLADEHILETVLTTSWACHLCSLSTGLGVKPNIEPPQIPAAGARRTAFQPPSPRKPGEHGGPYLRMVHLPPESFQPFASVRQRWGFVPNLFQAQTMWPDLVEAELLAVNLWLNTGDVLTQRQKECIFLAVSAANLNTYCVAAHCEILRGLGVSGEDADQIALDHHNSNLSGPDKALLDVCLKLARQPAAFGQADIEVLRRENFSELHILEAVLVAAIANFINTLNTGLGVVPDFEPVGELKNRAHLFPAGDTLMKEQGDSPPPEDAPYEDPDAACVARVQAGDAEAFEELVRRHGRRVYRTLAGILRKTEDIEDAAQDTFVKAFRHIGDFEGRSRFSTWLTRIAVNTGLHRLRSQKEFESLDASPEIMDDFRPRQVQAWQEDPERSYSKAEMQELIQAALTRLPPKYRVVVTLRDLQQLSTAETASLLGLQIPAVKARLFRGRLMLREALTPYFAKERVKRTHG